MNGIVKMFNKDKGYGFITAEDKKDVFFHYSSIEMEGYKTANQGDKVEFELETSDRGLRANHVKIVAHAPSKEVEEKEEKKAE